MGPGSWGAVVDPRDRALAALSGGGEGAVKTTPMPGAVVRVLVQAPGDTVDQGPGARRGGGHEDGERVQGASPTAPFDARSRGGGRLLSTRAPSSSLCGEQRMTDDDLQRWRETVRAKALARVPERRPASAFRRRAGRRPVHASRHARTSTASAFPGSFPYTRGSAAHHVPRCVLDHAAVRRVRNRSRVQRALSIPAIPGNDRPFGRLRSPDSDGVRLRR